jgi:hypothetical protein
MSTVKPRTVRGQALLETLLTQLVAGVTAGALFSLIATAHRVDRKAAQFQHLVHTASLVRSYSGRIISLSDTHRLEIPPQAGPPDAVITLDGRSLSEILQGSSVAPSAEHGVLYNFGVAAGSVFHIPTSAVTVSRCTTIPLSYPPERYRYGLIVSERGIFVLPITLRPADAAKQCYQIGFGSSVRTLALLPNSTRENERGLRALLPIEREEALYVDQYDRVRYVRLEGGHSVENQPLSDSIHQLSFSLSPSVAEQVTVYSTTIIVKVPGIAKTSFSVSSQLGRQNWWNTLLWAL